MSILKISKRTPALVLIGVFGTAAASAADVQQQAQQLLLTRAMHASNQPGGVSESAQSQAARFIRAGSTLPSASMAPHRASKSEGDLRLARDSGLLNLLETMGRK